MTNLYEQIAEEEKLLSKEEDKTDGETPETPEAREKDGEEKEASNEEQAEDKTEGEEAGEEPKKEEIPELKPDATAFAKARKEKREAEERAEKAEQDRVALAERLKSLEEQINKKEEIIPDKDEDYEGYLEYQRKQDQSKIDTIEKKLSELEQQRIQEQQAKEHEVIRDTAVKEFMQYEREFKNKVEDYEDAAVYAHNKIKESIATIYPTATQEELTQATARVILNMSIEAKNQGYNPAEKLYHDAKTRFGYKGKENAGKKGNLDALERNKKRSANSLDGGVSKSSTTKTMAELARASNAEFASNKLSFEDIKNLK